jgi:HAMP domain-containing protein
VVTTSNTLKEISELKNEIIKLTQSLRVLKGAEDDSP